MKRPRTKHPTLLVIEKKLELPIIVLSFIWLFILILELVYGNGAILYGLSTGIWVLSLAYVCFRLFIAPKRLIFLQKNWLFALALFVSSLRLVPLFQRFLITRALTATFGVQVIWIFVSADQGMRSLRRKLGHRGVGYALTFTFVVIFVGAGGILHFEQISEDPQSIHTYPVAIWWTAMQMTNIGSSYSVRTHGGRAVCLGISLYAAAMFGYLTALFATFFIGKEASDPKSEIVGEKSIQEVRNEIVQLRHLIESRLNPPPQKDDPEGLAHQDSIVKQSLKL